MGLGREGARQGIVQDQITRVWRKTAHLYATHLIPQAYQAVIRHPCQSLVTCCVKWSNDKFLGIWITEWAPPKISKRQDPGVRTLFAKGVFENYEWKVDFTLSFVLFQTITLFNRKIHLYYKYKLPCLKSASPGKQVSCFPRWKRLLLNNLEEPSFQQVGTVHTTSSDAQFPSLEPVVQT